jgi:ubiquinone/menaquinone biosynthesis C-methylase UbiE
MEAIKYENAHYHYSEVFWGKEAGREYENRADQQAVSYAISAHTEWIADFGGGFGRLIPVLKTKASKIILVDASLDLLREARETHGVNPNIYYVRANLYHLPFHDDSIESAICMRVMHHIETPNIFLNEINRVISNRLNLEFPNKSHLLQRLRKYFFGDVSINTDSTMFLNFSLAYIRDCILQNTEFMIEKVFGVSFLRHRIFKQKIPLFILIAAEKMLQRFSFLATWAPSIMIRMAKINTKKHHTYNSIEEMFACPQCQLMLVQKNMSFECINGHAFEVSDGIFDFYIE